MAKKKNQLTCPVCLTRLLESVSHCAGVVVVCPHCGASVLADIDENGRMRLSVEPVRDQPLRTAATN